MWSDALEIEVGVGIGSRLLGPGLGPVLVESDVCTTSDSEAFFERKHFVSERLHCLQHGRLEDAHFLLKLDVKCTTQGFLKSTFYFILQCSTWGGTVCGVFNDKDSKCKGWGRGGEENKFSAAPSRSA